MIIIRQANVEEVKDIVSFIDSTFTKEGYGFVTSSQIETETGRRAVWIALDDRVIVGVRIGINRVYNLTVHPKYRKMGIGEQLIRVHPPTTIRVKSEPVGNMSKEQRENFKNPEGFYDSIGYEYSHHDYSKNFWAGETKDGKRKRIYTKQGKNPHIKVYQKKDRKQGDLFEDE